MYMYNCTCIQGIVGCGSQSMQLHKYARKEVPYDSTYLQVLKMVELKSYVKEADA